LNSATDLDCCAVRLATSVCGGFPQFPQFAAVRSFELREHRSSQYFSHPLKGVDTNKLRQLRQLDLAGIPSRSSRPPEAALERAVRSGLCLRVSSFKKHQHLGGVPRAAPWPVSGTASTIIQRRRPRGWRDHRDRLPPRSWQAQQGGTTNERLNHEHN
jgi:hypothetical protein